jgi:hypothetical protein
VPLKRLRVRLKASDPDSLAETFGANVSATGVFLKSKQLLPIGTPVLFELLYQNGERALGGRGSVESIRSEAEVSGMNLALEWAEDSTTLAKWVVGKRLPAQSDETVDVPQDPFEDVTVLAAERFDDGAEEPTLPTQRVQPRPPPAPVVQQRIGSPDAWDLVSDLIATPPPRMPPKLDDLDRAAMEDAFQETSGFGGTEYSHTDPSREPGEVTPLARIELVKTQKSDPIRTADIEPLEVLEEEEPPRATAIPSKRAPSKIAAPSEASSPCATTSRASSTLAAVPTPRRRSS